MGGISDLSDELLIKILSYLPTKVAASTMILSKQWQFLWLWSPNLEFSGSCESDSGSLQCFLLRNLPLYRAPVIERFSLRLWCLDIDPEEVKSWIQFAVSRNVLELDIVHTSDIGGDIVPNSLYTCKSLVTLKLDGIIYMGVPHMVCFPSLKTLLLEAVNFDHYDHLPRLLSNCLVLEDLSIQEFADGGKMMVRVPSLPRLSLQIIEHLDEFVLDTPSLDYLKLVCDEEIRYVSIKNMPKLREVYVQVSFSLFDKLISSIPSIRSLAICLSFENTSEVMFDDGFVFNKLRNVKLCTCEGYSANLLVKLLKVCPKLRVLELFKMEGHGGYMKSWNQPSSVPECLLSSIKTFKWSTYRGRKEERELMMYILLNAAHRIKTATIADYDVV